MAEPIQYRKDKRWQSVADFFDDSAYAANIGILIHALGAWIPLLALLSATGPLATLVLIADPLIYTFRALVRLTRLIGRNFSKVQFEEEKEACTLGKTWAIYWP